MSVQPTGPTPVLLHNVLNIVGENHGESDGRRDLEKEFVRQVLGPDKGYWVENEFLDLKDNVNPGRRKRGAQEQAKNQIADLREYRVAMGAALLIDNFGKLCAYAQVAGFSEAESEEQRDNAKDAVLVFVKEHFKKFLAFNRYIAGTYADTPTEAVNTAAKNVHAQVTAALMAYKDAMVNPSKVSLDDELKATRGLWCNREAVLALFQPLANAVGSKTGTAADLAKEMMKKRSEFMGIAANLTNRKGVWKVGDDHVRELKDGTANVGNNANIVTRVDFNKEFKVWLDERNKQQPQQSKT